MTIWLCKQRTKTILIDYNEKVHTPTLLKINGEYWNRQYRDKVIIKLNNNRQPNHWDLCLKRR